jgi:hypothetical protein
MPMDLCDPEVGQRLAAAGLHRPGRRLRCPGAWRAVAPAAACGGL